VTRLPTTAGAGRPALTKGTSLSDSIRLSSVTVNCPDAAGLAAFYADITGGRIAFSNPDWAVVNSPGGRIDFQTVPGHSPPTWPGNTSPNRLHLDFLVDDLAAAEARVLAAGATRYQFQPNSGHCLVFADPAGHPFCLTTLEDMG
jgi:catechol 2,3-dioxygenase-like lactoylglutathione lyase family enzyme